MDLFVRLWGWPVSPDLATDLQNLLRAVHGLWHEVQGVVLLIGLYIVVRRLHHERVRLSERVETLSQIVRATSDEAEEAVAIRVSAQNVPAAGRAQWEIIRSEWRNIRNRIELKIENIPWAQIRQRYIRFRRYRYENIINRLARDRLIEPHVREALVDMDKQFQAFRFNPNGVAPSDVQEFRRLLAIVNGALPQIETEESVTANAPEVAEARAADATEHEAALLPAILQTVAPSHWSQRPILLRVAGGAIVVSVVLIIGAMTPTGKALIQIALAAVRSP